MKNEARDFVLLRQKKQKEIFRRPDSYQNIFLKNLRVSAKVYTPHYADYEVVLDQVEGLKKMGTDYVNEFFSYMLEVELKVGADQVVDVPACLAQMKEFVERVLRVTQYQQEQSGMEKYM